MKYILAFLLCVCLSVINARAQVDEVEKEIIERGHKDIGLTHPIDGPKQMGDPDPLNKIDFLDFDENGELVESKTNHNSAPTVSTDTAGASSGAQSTAGAGTAKTVDNNPQSMAQVDAASTVPNKNLPEAEPFSPSAQATSVPPTRQPDDPDAKKERFFHWVYQTYNAAPHSDQEWEQVVHKPKAESYQVQSGDNLWAISGILFGDGYFWPKIWSLNDAITNPHEIHPGQTIKFFPGTMEQAPSVSVGENAQQPEQEAAAEQPKSEESAQPEDPDIPKGAEIPPPLIRSRGVTPIPPSLAPLATYGEDVTNGQDNILGFKEMALRRSHQTILPLTSYIIENPANPIGEVVETAHNGMAAFPYQEILVKLYEGASPGSNISVVRHATTLNDPDGERGTATVVEVQGEISIGGEVNPGERIFRARINRILQMMTVGSFLINEPVYQASVSGTGNSKDVGAIIMGGEISQNHVLLGLHSTVYINRGSDDGLDKGDELDVYSNRKKRNKDALVERLPQKTGRVRLVKVDKKFATGILTQTKDDVVVGDFVGKGMIVASQPSKNNDDLDLGPAPEINDKPTDEIPETFEEPKDNLDSQFDVKGPTEEPQASKEIKKDESIENLDAQFSKESKVAPPRPEPEKKTKTEKPVRAKKSGGQQTAGEGNSWQNDSHANNWENIDQWQDE